MFSFSKNNVDKNTDQMVSLFQTRGCYIFDQGDSRLRSRNCSLSNCDVHYSFFYELPGAARSGRRGLSLDASKMLNVLSIV